MNLQVIKNRLKKALAYSVTAVVFLIISAFLVIQIPPVQNYFVGDFLRTFTKVTGFTTSIDAFQMLWFDRLQLEGVSVYDTEGNQMIRAKQILVNFKLSNLLRRQHVNIDGVFVDSAHVFLTKINEDTARDLNINVFIAAINKNYGGSSGGGKSPMINIGEAFINQSQFTLINQDQDSIKNGFNFNQFSLSVDEAQLESFVILGDTTEFQLRTLIAEDLQTKFKVNQLSTFFRMCQTSMEFLGIDLRAGQTVISDTIIFTYKNARALNDFVSKVSVHANFNNTIIDPNDLAFFAPGVERIRKPVQISGLFNGRVENFKLTKMKIDVGNTHLTGSMNMDGLPNINETFMVIDLRNSIVDPNDLSFLFNERTLSRITPMGRLSMDGQFIGYPSDFVANGNFSGSLGAIRSDINFKVNEEDFDRSIYSGSLSLVSFDLGTYLNDTATFQKVTMNGRISGKGLSRYTADFQLDGEIDQVGIKGYDYTHIVIDARLASERFNGLVSINDPHLEMKAIGSIDLRQGKNTVKIRALLDTAYLQNLNLTKDSVFLRTELVADIKGLSLDSLVGTADFRDFLISYKNESLSLDTIHLDARREEDQRSFILQTSLADIGVYGAYNFSDLFNNIKTLSTEISLNIKNDKSAIANYYRNKRIKPKSYQTNIEINLRNVGPIATLLGIDLDLSRNTSISGSFTSGYTTIFQAYSGFDSLRYKGSLFLDTEVDFTASKIADSTNVLAMASISSGRQAIGPTLKTNNLLVEAIWDQNLIDFGLDVDQEKQTNFVRLKGAVKFLKDSTVLIMEPSILRLLEREWSFAPNNSVSVKGADWTFNSFSLVNSDQSVGLEGRLSEDHTRILNLNIDKLDLSLLNVLTKKKFEGIMDATVSMSNYYRDPAIQNDIHIGGLTIDDFLIGDVTGKNQWDTAHNKFNINFFIDHNQNRIVNLTGEYNPSDKKSPLAIDANLRKASLKILEPFLSDIFSQMGGTISGEYKITGLLEAPQIEGEGSLSDAQIMVNYLRTLYRITGKVGLTPTSIYFKDIELTDGFKNKGRLNGAITHRAFSNMSVGFDASFRNFQVMNTTIKDNSLFYGQAYATGTLNLAGPISNMRITSSARTEKNTRVYIPIGGTSSTDQQEFISFVNFTDTTLTKKVVANVSKKVKLTGITFDLNLDVTPEAYCEIIFDLKAGDIIRGRGNGELKLQVDTKGEFSMFGPFEFTEGWYNFTLYDIINKEFEIKKGSRITWLGDPYQAIMDIDASYNQLASISPIITNPTLVNDPQLKRKYPVKVLLALDGPMLSPAINFDITAQNLPQNIVTENGTPVNLDLEFTAFKNRLDEQELKRQVFSLIILRRFSPPESFNTSGSVVSSLSELLSNQLSYWMSQVDENLEIDVDIAAMDQESYNTFQLRFSYTFMNGRLRVTGDGTFNNTSSQPTTTGNSPSTVAGDWTVDYKLTADGKLRVKMYSRTNVNPILTSVNSQTAMTTGASIIHTQSFDELKDLFRSSRNQNKKEQEIPAVNQEAIKEEDGGE